MNFTNQELVQELQKRIKEGTLKAEVVADKFETETSTLLSKLDSKSLLLLVGLVTSFTLFICYSIKSTSTTATDSVVKFDCNPPVNNEKIEVPISLR
jgi:hypothetical protein